MHSPLHFLCLLTLNFIATLSLQLYEGISSPVNIGDASFPVKIGNVSIWFDRIPSINCYDFQTYVVKQKNIPDRLAWKYSKASDLCLAPPKSSVFPRQERNLTNKKIQLLHISKTGGTLVCTCGNNAGRNKGLKHGHLMNCHFLHEDEPFWGDHDVPGWAFMPEKDPKSINCNQLEAKYTEHHPAAIDLEGNENYLPMNGNLCPQFINVVVLRSPMHRLISHIVQILKLPQKIDAILNHTVSDFFQMWPIVTDNFMVRSLCGNQVYRLPFGHVNEDHLTRAKAILRNFDDVFITDSGLAGSLHAEYQWTSCKGNEGRTSPYEGGTQGLLDAFQKNWKSGQWQELVNQNKFDNELFQEGMMINKANRILFEHSCTVSQCPRSFSRPKQIGDPFEHK